MTIDFPRTGEDAQATATLTAGDDYKDRTASLRQVQAPERAAVTGRAHSADIPRDLLHRLTATQPNANGAKPPGKARFSDAGDVVKSSSGTQNDRLVGPLLHLLDAHDPDVLVCVMTTC
jgi:hypothetical protein